jgi:2-succinyl-5-enolpyruvyl-6-hydroxy-3-cyclohexene-1-carboxylate synthase
MESQLRVHSVLDERSAAFFALGRARADETPVAFLCTSGSAGAHALPALLEARYAGHRVIAITADRPPELHGCGANQTIDQEELFASACPPALQVGMPQSTQEAGLAMRRRVQEAVALALGPVHINLPFRKPLEPTEAERKEVLSGPPAEVISASARRVDEEAIDSILLRCKQAKRGLIVAGASTKIGPALQSLARQSGFVLLAESTSGARLSGSALAQRCDAFPTILAGLAPEDRSLDPDLILHFGREPACGALLRWLAKQECPQFRFTGDPLLKDSTGKSAMVVGEVKDACERIAAALSPAPAGAYLQDWRKADEEAWSRVAECIDARDASLSEARAMATVLKGLPSGSRLTLGNSMPVRAADMVLPGHLAQLEVLHQRGTSGIDGLIAGAIGSADSGPSALLIGDVSCAHDLSSLALAPMCRGPLAIIVVDNQGGQIFSHLPVAEIPMKDNERNLWSTPPAVDFEQACLAYRVPYREASSNEEVLSALAWSQEQEGCVFIHLRVPADSMRSFVRQSGEGRA